MLDILPIEKDDVSFVQAISSVVNKIVSSTQPRDCYILQLDNWFDHKWLLWPGQRPWRRTGPGRRRTRRSHTWSRGSSLGPVPVLGPFAVEGSGRLSAWPTRA